MKPIAFREQNVVFVAQGCGDLPAYKGEGRIISCWKLTFWERVKVLVTGRAWLDIRGECQPPVCVLIDKPFEPISRQTQTCRLCEGSGKDTSGRATNGVPKPVCVRCGGYGTVPLTCSNPPYWESEELARVLAQSTASPRRVE